MIEGGVFMSRGPIAALTIAIALGVASPARADITAFLGTNTTPSSRLTRGASLGMSLLVVGIEFEYCATDSDAIKAAPDLKTGMANGFLQTPVPLLRMQPYFTTGGGIYRETLGPHEDTGFGLNVGGGVKISLIGPLRLRADYRVFKLGSGALQTPAHRFYVGLNLKF
jgi:opacity protein-like surface antigen